MKLTVPDKISWGHESSRWLLQTRSSVNFILWRIVSPLKEKEDGYMIQTISVYQRRSNQMHGNNWKSLYSDGHTVLLARISMQCNKQLLTIQQVANRCANADYVKYLANLASMKTLTPVIISLVYRLSCLVDAYHIPSLPVPISWSSMARIWAWADMFPF